LEKSEIIALERIIELDGSCLNKDKCRECPFFKECWASYVSSEVMSKTERVNRASDILIRNNFFPDE